MEGSEDPVSHATRGGRGCCCCVLTGHECSLCSQDTSQPRGRGGRGAGSLLSRQHTDVSLCRALVNVTLDPETASPYLILSKDCKTVWLGDGQEDLPDSPKRFMGSPSVLGCQGFTAGRHYWELEVGDGDSWAVGVAVESVRRKDSLSMAMGKIWALRLDWNRQYTALHMPPAPLALKEEPRKIRVHVDYEAGQVTFYNAENMVQILQFKASFTEKVFPYFWLWSQKTYIQLCP